MEERESPYERAADDALRVLREAPPLALLAVVAALFELGLARVAWHGLPDVVDLETLRVLRDLGRFPRNLAAIAGIVGLLFALLAFLRHSGWAPIGRRLIVAAFSGVFVPSLLVATALPYASLRARLVVFSLGAANVLTTLIAVTAVRYRAPTGVRVAVGAMGATAFCSLLVVGLGLAMTAETGALGRIAALLTEHPGTSQRVLLGMRHVGEVCWMSVLVGIALAILHGAPPGRNARYLTAGALLAAVVAGAVALRLLVGHRFRLMIFGAFRFGLFLDDGSLLYALPIGVAIGAGLVGLAAKSPAVRQLAGGLLLWMAAGYAPHTPIQLLYLLFATMLVSRSAQALDPQGPWRKRHPWLSLMARTTPPRSPPTAR
ncbi:MAG: hypothetical protein KC619_24390 [Myxococcales bacterium]|nr:hypothetical protein [Myxococcales bacterium]